MRIQILNILFIVCLLVSCSHKQKDSSEHFIDNTSNQTKSKTIILQPFDGISQIVIDSLFVRLEKTVPCLKVRTPIPLPRSAYYKERNRYKADSLLRHLWMTSTTKSIILGLTDKDISITTRKYDDWGIMGLSGIPSHSCVTSTYRLAKQNLMEQLYKLSVHELGHAEGLFHCERSDSCFMRDAEGRNHFDELIHFCRFCKFHLTERGWKLNN